MSEEPKPCPCGLPYPAHRHVENKTQTGHWFHCECGWEGPVRETLSEAIAAWNRRAKPVVKALQWIGTESGGYAHTGTGVSYGIKAVNNDLFVLSRFERSSEFKSAHDTWDDASAAAQADFTRRVHACLEEYDD